ncbi:MAG: hypothetical protein RMY34_24945 [Aulosira sp. DedQUE10]|nr:hypothetical protein [Aulosira sp. DedQUE10]
MWNNSDDLPKANSTIARAQINLWHELSEIEQESLLGGRKVEAIIRPFKLDEVYVSITSQYGIQSIPTLM